MRGFLLPEHESGCDHLELSAAFLESEYIALKSRFEVSLEFLIPIHASPRSFTLQRA